MYSKINKDVKNCIDDKDEVGLQCIFIDCLDADPTFEKSKDDYEYCKQNAKWIFEEYRELTPLSQNPSDWNEQYWSKIKFDLHKNFCDERFQHMVKVAKVVYKDKIERLKKEREKDIPKVKPRESNQGNVTTKRVVRTESVRVGTSDAKVSGTEGSQTKQEPQKYTEKNEQHYGRSGQDKQETSRQKTQGTRTNGDSSKKAQGVVLPIVLVVIIAGVVIKLFLL